MLDINDHNERENLEHKKKKEGMKWSLEKYRSNRPTDCDGVEINRLNDIGKECTLNTQDIPTKDFI